MNYKALVMSLSSLAVLAACTTSTSGSNTPSPGPTIVIDDPIQVDLFRRNDADGVNVDYEHKVATFSTNGMQSVSRKLVVQNTLNVGIKLSNTPVFISSPVSEGDTHGFTQANDCPAILAPAQLCTVTVYFNPPVAAGSKYNQILSVGGTTNDANKDEIESMTQLSGVISSPNSFSSSVAGTITASAGNEYGHPNFDYITVFNNSSGAVKNLTFSSLGSFSLIATNCGDVLKAGDGCFIFTDGRNTGANSTQQVTISGIDYLGGAVSQTVTLTGQGQVQSQ